MRSLNKQSEGNLEGEGQRMAQIDNGTGITPRKSGQFREREAMDTERKRHSRK